MFSVLIVPNLQFIIKASATAFFDLIKSNAVFVDQNDFPA